MIKIFITIDTEEDRKSNKSLKVTSNNLKKIGRFQLVCEKFGVKPVYFCSYETANNKYFVDLMKPRVESDSVEIGAHLHPWSTPPFSYGDPIEERKNSSYPHEYPLEIFEKKLTSLTELIKNEFKVNPVSYRAGRFGFINEHIPILSRLGYSVDSSITPHISWEDTPGWKKSGVNFSQYKATNEFDIFFNGYFLKEYPITILPPKNLLKKIKNKIFNRKTAFRWLRIYPQTTIKDLLSIIKDAEKTSLSSLVFMMHSNEFDYQSNPYFKTQKAENKLYNLLEKFYIELRKSDIKSYTFRQTINLENDKGKI